MLNCTKFHTRETHKEVREKFPTCYKSFDKTHLILSSLPTLAAFSTNKSVCFLSNMCLFESDLHKLILPAKYKKDNNRGLFFWMDPGWEIFFVKRG